MDSGKPGLLHMDMANKNTLTWPKSNNLRPSMSSLTTKYFVSQNRKKQKRSFLDIVVFISALDYYTTSIRYYLSAFHQVKRGEWPAISPLHLKMREYS